MNNLKGKSINPRNHSVESIVRWQVSPILHTQLTRNRPVLLFTRDEERVSGKTWIQLFWTSSTDGMQIRLKFLAKWCVVDVDLKKRHIYISANYDFTVCERKKNSTVNNKISSWEKDKLYRTWN